MATQKHFNVRYLFKHIFQVMKQKKDEIQF